VADSKDAPKGDKKADPAEGVANPWASADPSHQDDRLEGLDPTKVVGDWAEQPDPNTERPAPGPNVPKGVKKAPADDAPDAASVGEGKNV